MQISRFFQRRSTSNQLPTINTENIHIPPVDINIPFYEQNQTFVFDRERFSRAINDQNEQLLRAFLQRQQPSLPHDRTLFPSRTDAAQSTEPQLPSGASSLRNMLELRCRSDTTNIPDEIRNNADFFDFLERRFQDSDVHITCAVSLDMPVSLSKVNEAPTRPHILDFDTLVLCCEAQTLDAGEHPKHPLNRSDIHQVERDFEGNEAFEAFILKQWQLFSGHAMQQPTGAPSARQP